RSRQRPAEPLPFLEHEPEILQEEVELHLGLEAPLDHERAAHVDHLRRARAVLQAGDAAPRSPPGATPPSSASTSASASAAVLRATSRLVASFASEALPAGPMWTARLAVAARTGPQGSTRT